MTEFIRRFSVTNQELGVEEQFGKLGHSAWFVMDRARGDNEWHTHCGPYSSRDEAVWWIQQIRDTK